MKFIHTGDLHLGKTVNDFSMLEEQKAILQQIIECAREERADAVVLAGDIYDRAIPPAEAVTLLNDFLTELVRLEIPVLMISGNHDSPERLGFAEEILQKKGITIAGVYRGELKKATFSDSYGKVTFVLMPYIKPSAVQAETCGEAVGRMLKKEGLADAAAKGRYVLVTHFFVTDGDRQPELSDGETSVHVGGLDNVEASLFAPFDYAALGHIHKPQRIGNRQVYYAGAPLAFSFSEAGKTKYMNLVELKEKGSLTVRQLPFRPLHEMRRIRGRIEELTAPDIVQAENKNDYIQAVLTNEEELIDPAGTLRSVYPNLMQIVLAKNEEKWLEWNEDQGSGQEAGFWPEKRRSIHELFSDFYRLVRQEEPDEERKRVIEEAAREAEERL